MTIQAPYDFRQLREANYPEKTFDTGHFGFDVYFQKGRSWKPDHDALDVAMRQSNDALLAVVPHLKSLENEPPESLGRSMLINSYAIPRNGPGMYEISSQKRSMVQTALRIFAAFAKRLETPRMSEQDVCALLTQIPEALYQDYLECFHDLFFASFPAGVSDETCVIVSEFLDQFLALGDFGIFGYSDCSKIIARHTNLMTAIGRDLDSHPFYQEQARVFYRSMRTAAFVLPELGPLHQQIAALSNFGASPIKRSMRYQLGTLFNTAGYKGVWKSVADNCRLKRSEFDPPSFEDWRRVGLPFRAKFITVSAVSEKDDQLAPQCDDPERVLHRMVLNEDDAAILLEHLARFGNRYASNRPALTDTLAQGLACQLPKNRPDLEVLIKETRHNTSGAAKQVLIDALTGKKRGTAERLIRKHAPSFVKFREEPEQWQNWISAKREALLDEIQTELPVGAADPASMDVPDWGSLRGQLYAVDAMGYAKCVARAQSGGADVTQALDDLRALARVAHQNLACLVQTDDPLMNVTPEEEADVAMDDVQAKDFAEGECFDATQRRRMLEAMIDADQPSKPPSRFGLLKDPSRSQLIRFETATLHALDSLIQRIALLVDCPALVTLEKALRNPSQTQPHRSSDWIFFESMFERALQDGVPAGLADRLRAIDTALLDGPYIIETEPSFTDVEFQGWRASIWAAAFLPVDTGIPLLTGLVERFYVNVLRPHAPGSFTHFEPKGQELGHAALVALMFVPGFLGKDALESFLPRAPYHLEKTIEPLLRLIEVRQSKVL